MRGRVQDETVKAFGDTGEDAARQHSPEGTGALIPSCRPWVEAVGNCLSLAQLACGRQREALAVASQAGKPHPPKGKGEGDEHKQKMLPQFLFCANYSQVVETM